MTNDSWDDLRPGWKNGEYNRDEDHSLGRRLCDFIQQYKPSSQWLWTLDEIYFAANALAETEK